MLLSLDGTFLIQMLNFVVFWVLLNYLFIAPTWRAIEARQAYIASQFAQAEELRGVADKVRAEADKVLDAARRQTAQAMREANAQADDLAREIENRAAAEANALVQTAHATVKAEHDKAVEAQGPFVDELARTMVERATRLESAA